jgi:hypothetical protein
MAIRRKSTVARSNPVIQSNADQVESYLRSARHKSELAGEELDKELERTRGAEAKQEQKRHSSGGVEDAPPAEQPLIRGTGVTLSPIGSGASAPTAIPASATGGGHYKLTSDQKAEMASAIRATADRLGVDPNHLATAMSFETGGTLNPWQAGPTTKYGQHMGLIQWGEPQRQQYGVHSGMSITEQVNAAGKYLQDRGVKSGMGLENIYAAILRGNASHVDHVTDSNGTSVISAVENMRRSGHAHALERLEGGVTTPTTASQPTPTAPKANDAGNTAQRRAEAIPTNQIAADTGTMNDASPSRQQMLGGVQLQGSGASLSPISKNTGTTQMASAATPASSTPQYLTNDQVLEAVRKGEHVTYDKEGHAISTSAGALVTSGNPTAIKEAMPTAATTPAPATPAAQPSAIPAQAGGNWQNGMPQPGDKEWHAPMAAPATSAPNTTAAPAAPQSVPQTAAPAQTGGNDPLGEFGQFLSDIFSVPDNWGPSDKSADNWDPLYGNTAQAIPAEAPQDNGGSDFGSVFGGLFGFNRGGAVKGYALGGPIGDLNPQTVSEVSSPEHALALAPVTGLSLIEAAPTSELVQVADSGSSRNDATPASSTTPAPAAIPSSASATPAPAPATAIPAGELPMVYRAPDVSTVEAPKSERELAAAEYDRRRAEQEAESYRRAQFNHRLSLNDGTLGGMLQSALFDAMSGMEQQFTQSGLPQRLQTGDRGSAQQAIPTGADDRTIFDDIGDFFFGPEAQAQTIKPAEMKKLQTAAGVPDGLNEGVKNLAVLYRGYSEALANNDPKAAQQFATSMVWNSMRMASQYGEQAYKAFRVGDNEKGLEALRKGMNIVPTGSDLRIVKDGDNAVVEEFDVRTGKRTNVLKAGPEDFMAAALGLKNGSATLNMLNNVAAGRAALAGAENQTSFSDWAEKADAATQERLKTTQPLFDGKNNPTVPDDPNLAPVTPLGREELEKMGITAPVMPPRPPSLTASELAPLSPKDRITAVRQRNQEMRAWDIEAESKKRDYVRTVADAEKLHRIKIRGDNQTTLNANKDKARETEATAKADRELDKPLTPAENLRVSQTLGNAFDDSNYFSGKNLPDEARTNYITVASGLMSSRRNQLTPEDSLHLAEVLASPNPIAIKLGKEGDKPALLLPDGRKLFAPPAVIAWREGLAKSRGVPAWAQ